LTDDQKALRAKWIEYVLSEVLEKSKAILLPLRATPPAQRMEHNPLNGKGQWMFVTTKSFVTLLNSFFTFLLRSRETTFTYCGTKGVGKSTNIAALTFALWKMRYLLDPSAFTLTVHVPCMKTAAGTMSMKLRQAVIETLEMTTNERPKLAAFITRLKGCPYENDEFFNDLLRSDSTIKWIFVLDDCESPEIAQKLESLLSRIKTCIVFSEAVMQSGVYQPLQGMKYYRGSSLIQDEGFDDEDWNHWMVCNDIEFCNNEKELEAKQFFGKVPLLLNEMLIMRAEDHEKQRAQSATSSSSAAVSYPGDRYFEVIKSNICLGKSSDEWTALITHDFTRRKAEHSTWESYISQLLELCFGGTASYHLECLAGFVRGSDGNARPVGGFVIALYQHLLRQQEIGMYFDKLGKLAPKALEHWITDIRVNPELRGAVFEIEDILKEPAK
jgi:hypothetical protein